MDKAYRGTLNPPPRILKHRKQVKVIYHITYFLGFLFLAMGLNCILLDLASSLQEGGVHQPSLLYFYEMGVGVFLLTWNYFYLRKFISIQVQAFEDHLLIKKNNIDRVIFYKEIVKIQHKVNSSFGGYLSIILKNGEIFKFSVILERPEYILEAVLKFNPSLMDPVEFTALRRELILADHKFGWIDMFYSIRGVLNYLLIGVGGVFFLTAFFYVLEKLIFPTYSHLAQIDTLYFYSIFAVLLLAGLTISYYLFNTYFITKKSMETIQNNKRRDFNFEKKLMKDGLKRHMMGAFIISLTIFFLGPCRHAVIFLSTNKVSGLSNLEKNIIIFDTRKNCFNCLNSLEKGDLVGIEQKNINGNLSVNMMRIIKGPSESTMKEIRHPASSSQHVGETIQAQDIFTNEIVLVNQDQIIGKVINKSGVLLY